MAELSFDIFAIACGNRAPAPVPAPEHGEREPELPEHPFTRHLKRPAETSPQVSPGKPRVAARVESDDELDPEDGGAPEPADAGTEERTGSSRMGSDRDRWEARQNASVVNAQIVEGCSPKCGCVFAHGLVLKQKVLSNRAVFAGMREPERRKWLREYLFSTGGELLWGDVAKRACVTGFSVFTGFTPSFIYARLKDYADGIVADDPNLGGARVKGLVGGGDDSSDSPTAMAAYGWFQGIILEIEPAPNTHIHEIDFMEKHELYADFHDDMSSTGTLDIASYATWLNVWHSHLILDSGQNQLPEQRFRFVRIMSRPRALSIVVALSAADASFWSRAAPFSNVTVPKMWVPVGVRDKGIGADTEPHVEMCLVRTRAPDLASEHATSDNAD